MDKYIDILVTLDGVFCAAPPWSVKVGDCVCMPDVLTGAEKVHEVISVATDSVGGEFVTMIEKYIGFPLPKIKAKYMRSEVEWDEPVQE